VLLRAVVTMAESALQAFGEFPPYGAGLAGQREVVPLPITADAQRGDAVAALRCRLADALRSGEVRATALAYEVKVMSPPSTFKTDGIGILLQHRDGYSAVHVVPYELSAGKVTFGQAEVIEQRLPRPGT
jgi:hypothetical protein